MQDEDPRVAKFVDANEIDVFYFEKPYYVVPQDDLAEEAYIVLRDALRAKGVRADGRGLVFATETAWMFPLAEMVLRACATRTESRGPHLFFASASDPEPLPRDEAAWRRYIVIRRGEDGTMNLEACVPERTGNSEWVAEHGAR